MSAFQCLLNGTECCGFGFVLVFFSLVDNRLQVRAKQNNENKQAKEEDKTVAPIPQSALSC